MAEAPPQFKESIDFILSNTNFPSVILKYNFMTN